MKKFKANVILLAFRGSPLPAARVEVEAATEVDACEAVFGLAQNVDESWIKDHRVEAVFQEGTTQEFPKGAWPDGLRSLSVGDRVELIGIGTWEVKPSGWERLPA